MEELVKVTSSPLLQTKTLRGTSVELDFSKAHPVLSVCTHRARNEHAVWGQSYGLQSLCVSRKSSLR